MSTEINLREQYQTRAKECIQGLKGLMTEAKKEGYQIEVYVSLGIDGQPQERVVVSAR